MEFFDSHSHYNDEKFDVDREQIIKETYESGITKFVCAGYNIKSSIFSLELSKKHEYIYSIIGISPNDIPDNIKGIKEEIDQLNELYRTSEKIVAVGEIGLDYHWNTENKDLQRYAFIEQIKLANKLELPIQIHTRDAVMDTIDILKTNDVKCGGIFHCCPFNRELVKEGLKLGFYISFAGPTTFKNSKNASEIINMVPDDRLLVETDSPYLSPEPYRGKRNDPRKVQYILMKIAEVKGRTFEEVQNMAYENAKRIFRIK